MRYISSFTVLVIVWVVCWSMSVANAQTGVGLMGGFASEETIEFSSGFRVGREGEVETTGGARPAVRWTQFDSEGRMDLSRGDDDGGRRVYLGFSSRQIDLDTTFVGLPERLVDHAVALGFELGEIDGFEVSTTVGLGYAGTTPFGDGDAVYGLANVVATKKLNERSWLTLLVNYDGHRTFLPDTPLPGVMFRQYVTSVFSYTIGFPVSGLTWEPNEKLKVELQLLGLSTAKGTVTYELIEAVSVFGYFERDTTAVMIDAAGPKRRLFFDQSRVEVGLRWRPDVGTGGVATEVTIAGGYAFDQEFRTGWDLRDDTGVVDLSDEPFVRVAARFGF